MKAKEERARRAGQMILSRRPNSLGMTE